MSAVERRFTPRGETRFVLEVPDYCVVLDVDRVKRNRWEALGGELAVRCSLSGASTIDGDLLWSGDVSFSSPGAPLMGRVSVGGKPHEAT